MNKANYLIMKMLMFISSYCPLYIMVLLHNFDKFNSVKNITKLFETANYKVIAFISLLFILLLLSFFSVYDIKKTQGNELYEINNIERPDDTVISYMMTYIVPLLTTDTLSNKVVTINLFLFILIGYMYIRLNLIYLNPLWSIFGYIMYKTDTDMIIVTNISYANIKLLTKNKNLLKGTFLGGNIYLIQKNNNLY